MEKFGNFLFGTKLGYLTFYVGFGAIMWMITSLIFISISDIRLNFFVFMIGYMPIGLITLFTKYRDWPWFTPKDE